MTATKTFGLWRSFLGLYRGSRWILLLSVLLSATQIVFLLSIAYFVGQIFDRVLPEVDILRLREIAFLILAAMALNSLAAIGAKRLSIRISKSASLNLRESLLAHCYRLSRSFYTNADTAKLHVVLVQDSDRVDNMGYALISQVLPAAIISVVLIGGLAFINFQLFVISLLTAPVLLGVAQLLRTRLFSSHQDYLQAFRTFSRGVLFVLQKMEATRMHAAESFEAQRQKQHIDRLSEASASAAWYKMVYSEVQVALVAVGMVVVLVVGGGAVVRGQITIGTLFSFYAMLALLANYLRSLWLALPIVITGQQSLQSLIDILNVREEIPYKGQRRINFKGEITLENVSFSYDERQVLSGVSFNLRPGVMTAIVGPNGAGKTTLGHLILGFYRPGQGYLCADGCPYDELDLQFLRGQIGIVAQNPIVFSGTILENVIYGCPEATPAEVEKACRLSTAFEFIQGLMEGYQTVIGENGIKLSGGQRQRIAIARALVRRPPLLILDEPTNHLDIALTQQLMHNITTLDFNPAILLITHYRNIADRAHEMYAIENGCMTKVGPEA
jgi:ABC-type bacteriocin/lantibiotic exporter with double-glycine peptidase domain